MLLTVAEAAMWLGARSWKFRGSYEILKAVQRRELPAVFPPNEKIPKVWLSDLYRWTEKLPRVQTQRESTSTFKATPYGPYPMSWLSAIMPIVYDFIYAISRTCDRNEREDVFPEEFEGVSDEDLESLELDLVTSLAAKMQEMEGCPKWFRKKLANIESRLLKGKSIEYPLLRRI